MPATTPRGYPYSIPTDPTDIPQAIEDLAEAIDADVAAREASIHARPAFRLSGFAPPVNFFASVAGLQSRTLPFDTQDALVEGAIAPLQGSTPTITPLLPGYWFFQASMTYPRTGATLMNTIGISIQTGTQTLARNSTHVPPQSSDGGNNVYVSAGTYMNGTTDYIQVLGHANALAPASGTPTMSVRHRYIVGYRMTEV